jgi:hypothetical protein
LAVWQFGSLAVWQFGSLAVWQFGSLAVWQFGSLAVWQFFSPPPFFSNLFAVVYPPLAWRRGGAGVGLLLQCEIKNKQKFLSSNF